MRIHLLFLSIIFYVVCNSFADNLQVYENKNNSKLLITIDTVSGTVANSIPVRISNVPEDGIFSGDIKISYNSEEVFISSIEGGPVIKNIEIDFDKNVDSANNAFIMIFLDATQKERPITEDGVFAYIKADVKNNKNGFFQFVIDTANCSFSDIDLNPISFNCSNGGISNLTIAEKRRRDESQMVNVSMPLSYCRIKNRITSPSKNGVVNIMGAVIKRNNVLSTGLEIHFSNLR